MSQKYNFHTALCVILLSRPIALADSAGNLNLFDDNWRHVCVAWSGTDGWMKLYLSDING